MKPPSPFRLEQAMSALMSVRQRLLEDDPDIASDEKLLIDMLDGEGGDAMEVLHRLVRASLHAHSMAGAAKERIADMSARERRYERREGVLRGAVFAAMHALEVTKIEQPDFTVGISDGAPTVIITDETALPEAFIRVQREPDKSLIGTVLKAGKQVPGAELSNPIPRLTVRTK